MKADTHLCRKERHQAYKVRGDRPKPEDQLYSAEGAAYLSPAIQRWVDVSKGAESRRDGTRVRICHAYGTSIHFDANPALKRRAKIFRPAGGTGSFAFTTLLHCRNTNRNLALPAASTMGPA